ncbi:hypothetical protein AgCh_017451 [Apium graveolens]
MVERIKDNSGNWCETPEEVQVVIEDYFSSLFTSVNSNGRLSEREEVGRISEIENDGLISAVTEEEVKSAVFSMHSEKSPGSDGFNPAFYQSFWEVVKEDVIHFCREFMSTGELPAGVNQTIICLIPKSAFVEGRLLTDNALIAFEINHFMRRKTQGDTGIAGLKIDISKAYDRLEWDFVKNMMQKSGFHQLWIDRVMKMVSSVTYKFTHNGQEFGSVIPSRGLRQGDPISPYLYIICAEALSAMIRRNENVGLIHGCTIARGAPTISHLLFADDCYLFFRAVEMEASVMKRILNRYEEISGQVVNFMKSAVVFSSNTKAVDRMMVCDLLGVREVNQPGTYLGMPMVVGRRKVSTFKFVVGKVEQKLQAWGSKNISKAGKVTLLKTAAQTIPNFWMSLFLFPKEIIGRIERCMNAFWWGSSEKNGGIKWMAWDRICEVKEAGGLGFKKLTEFNLAMLSKQAWRLVNNVNPLVTQLLKARYYPKSDFLNASLGTNPSYVWRSILEAQKVMSQGCRKRIGDGKDTRIWQIPWLPDAQNGCLTSDVYPGLGETTVHGKRILEETLEFKVARRNKWVWEKIVMSVFGIKQMALRMLEEWNRAREVEGRQQDVSVTRRRTWCKPTSGWVKVNIDAACPAGSNHIAVGCVVRDEDGLFLRARSNIIRGTRTPREAEALSLLEALSWVKEWRCNQCVFESDSKLLIDAIQAPKGRSLFVTIVEDCNELAKHYENVLFQFVPRSANSVAHEIARAACSNSGLSEWQDIAPTFLICNLLMDNY